MCDKNKRYDITSADDKIIGFEYQYYYFMYELLTLEKGQTIAFEEKDDIHKEIVREISSEIKVEKSDKMKLYQLKYTSQVNVAGTPINLTELDPDLWKTLFNWIQVIEMEKDKKKFVNSTEFIFVTNKNLSKNTLVNKINTFKEDDDGWCDLEEYITTSSSQSQDVSLYIQAVKNLEVDLLKIFLKNVIFINQSEDIIKVIKEKIAARSVYQNVIDDIFDKLYSGLKQEFFKVVKKRKHQIMTYDDWNIFSLPIFNAFRGTTLVIRDLKPSVPPRLQDLGKQNFIKELIEM